MKTLLLLGCSFCLGACGDGGNGAGTFQAPAQTGIESQAPQTPSDSVPATNSQRPALNDQAPPLNSQQPNLGGSTSTSTIGCAAVAAAVQAGDCQISDTQMSICLNLTAAGAPCTAQVQSLLACILERFECEQGLLDFAETCAAELSSLGTCVNDLGSPSTCSPSSFCAGCTETCDRCQCDLQLDPSAGSSCTQECSND